MANNLLVDLFAAWKLDENDGTRFDAHTGGFDILIEAGAPIQTTGIKDNAINFGTAESNRLSRADDNSFSFSSDFSIGAWMRQPGNQNNPLLAKWDSSDTPNVHTEWLIWHRTTNDKLRFLVSDDGVGTTTEVEAGIATPRNVWNFVTCGFQSIANEIWIQINAADRVTASHTTGVYGGATVNLTLGWFQGLSRIMGNQDQDETYVWTKYITSDEHDTMYASGTGLFFESFDGVSAGGSILDTGANHYRRSQRLRESGRKS